jgi:peptide methionine sulfoxide reductase msrA/msrB
MIPITKLLPLLVLALACQRAEPGSPPENGGFAKGSKENEMQNTDARSNAPAAREVAVLAGGCFWGMEDILRKVPGVLETEVGYAGGTTASPSYSTVKTGQTGHAEAIRVVFDPSRLSYAELLDQWFFRMHDPTTLNRQGNDIGTQYRSAIFYETDEQKRVAEEVKARLDQSGAWKRPIVTQIVKAGPFTPAEDYHQDYLLKHPGGYTCHYMRDL